MYEVNFDATQNQYLKYEIHSLKRFMANSMKHFIIGHHDIGFEVNLGVTCNP